MTGGQRCPIERGPPPSPLVGRERGALRALRKVRRVRHPEDVVLFEARDLALGDLPALAAEDVTRALVEPQAQRPAGAEEASVAGKARGSFARPLAGHFGQDRGHGGVAHVEHRTALGLGLVVEDAERRPGRHGGRSP
jgi:hypothetical protein